MKNHYVDSLIDAGGKALHMAYEMMRKATADEVLREKAIAREKFQMDVYSAVEDAKMLAEKKGESVASIRIATRMKAKGMSIEDIAELTGLSAEEIENL